MRTLTAKIVNTEDSDQELAMRVWISALAIILIASQTVSLKKEIEDLKSTKGALEQDLQSKKAELQHTKRALEDHIVSLEVCYFSSSRVMLQIMSNRTVLLS